MEQAKRRIVVLLGMHRSGTSLTMSMLHSLGVACGDALIPAGRGNPAGFWENAEVVAVQEELLAALQRVWHGPTGTHPLPDGWLASRPARRARERLVRIVEKGVAECGGVWGFKDPRTARLLPLWRDVFAGVRIRPAYVLSIRHPAAVCASLARHNGMDERRGQLLWLVHNLDALRDAGDDLLLVTDYDRLVEHTGPEVERMARALGGFMDISAPQRADAVARVSPALRSHGAKGGAIQNTIMQDAHQGLQAMARGEPRSEALTQLVARYPDLEALFLPWREDTRPLFLDWALRLVLRRKYR